MARVRPDHPLVMSVLDRLINHNPGATRERAASRFQVLRDLIVTVRRDLENLLNTRVRCVGAPEYCTELNDSLVNYGIPDVTGVSIGSSQDRDQFCRILQTVIRRFEPRFQTVTVVATQGNDPHDRTFRFRIDALLIAEPAPEPVVFDSELRPGTGFFRVKGVAE